MPIAVDATMATTWTHEALGLRTGWVGLHPGDSRSS
jgi:hypothetical protein